TGNFDSSSKVDASCESGCGADSSCDEILPSTCATNGECSSGCSYTSYSASQSACYCKECGTVNSSSPGTCSVGSYNLDPWSAGGWTGDSTGSCCIDYPLVEDGIGADGSTSQGCCDSSSDCVDDGQCFTHGSTTDTGGGDGTDVELCYDSKWQLPDDSQTYCDVAGFDYSTSVQFESGYGDCCGDDSNEYTISRDCSSGICPVNTNDWACCDQSNDCVYDATCYTNGQTVDVDGDTYLEVCSANGWYDGDDPEVTITSYDTISPSDNWAGDISSDDIELEYTATDETNIHYCEKHVRDGSTASYTSLGTVACGVSSTTIDVGSSADCSVEGANECGVRIYAFDEYGNSAYDEIEVGVDLTPPTSSVSGLSQYQMSSSWTIDWSGTDGLSGLKAYDIQYQKNGGSWTDCLTGVTSTSITFPSGCSPAPSVSDGDTFAFRSRAQDYVANVESYPAGADASTTVDLNPPSSSINPNGVTWESSDQPYDISCSDAGSGCDTTYWQEVASTASCPSQGSFSNSGSPTVSDSVTCASGTVCHSKICYYSEDAVSRTESTKTSNTFNIDMVDPISSIVSPANGSWHSEDFNVTFSDSDADSGLDSCFYKILDNNVISLNQESRPCNDNITIDVSQYCTTDGVDTCQIASTVHDVAGNVFYSDSTFFSIDTGNPSTDILTSGTWYGDDISVSVNDSNNSGSPLDTCLYRVDDGNDGTFETSWTSRTCPDGGFTVPVPGVCSTNGQDECRVDTFVNNSASTNDTNTVLFDIDTTSPVYDGYSGISGYSYDESSTVYWVTGGDTFTIDISHSDVHSGVNRQYFGFNHDDCSPNGCGGAPDEIKSYNNYGSSFNDWLEDDTYIDITGSSCVDADSNCADDDMTLRWNSDIAGTASDWDYKLHTYHHDAVFNGLGYTDLGVWVKIDNSAPSTSFSSPAISSWHDGDFSISTSDSDSRSGLSSCSYRVDDGNDGTYDTTWQSRTCGSSFTQTVGPSGECSVEGSDECKVQLRAVDNVGITTDVTRTFSIDYSAPTTTANPTNRSWDNTSISVDITASDGGSGVDSIEYCWTTSASCTPSTSVTGNSTTVTQSSTGSWTLCHRALDNQLHIGSTTCDGDYNIDLVDPASSVDSLPSYTGSTFWTVSWTGSDSHSGIDSYDLQYQKNGGSWTDCVVDYTLGSYQSFPSGCSPAPSVSDGDTFAFRSRAKDVAGNVESYPAGADASTTVDTSAPTSTITPDGVSWQNTDQSYDISCSDAGSGCDTTYWQEVASTASCPSQGSFSNSGSPTVSGSVDCSPGSVCQVEVCYYSDDTHSNIESTKTSNTFNIDKKLPVTSIDSPTAGTWQSGDFAVDISDSDADSGLDVCEYRILDNGVQSLGWTSRTCGSGATIDISAYCTTDGADKCAVESRATDVAGNNATDSRSFSIDVGAPIVSYQIPTPADSSRQIDNTVNISVSVDSTSDVDTCTLEWNGTNETMTKTGSGASVTCDATKTTVDGSTNTFQVYANNTVGTIGNETERSFVENTKPPAPTHLTPTDGQRTVGNSQTLSWTAGGTDAESDTITYYWRIDTDSTPAEPYTCSGSTTTLSSTSCSTTDGTTYYWNIVASDGYENQTVTTPWNFTENNDPTVNSVSLSSTSGNNLTSDDLDVAFSTSDPDSDPVIGITDWRIDGT
ncbi:MAG: hypothetical protein ACQESC_01875, partial [Nanobdellota archaeon]